MMRDDTAKHIMDFGSEAYRRLIDAEAEIKRLRSELDGCKVTEKDLGGIIRAQEDEIERLRAQLELDDDDRGEMLEQITRLRAALEEAQKAAIVGDAPHVIVITRRALKD